MSQHQHDLGVDDASKVVGVARRVLSQLAIGFGDVTAPQHRSARLAALSQMIYHASLSSEPGVLANALDSIRSEGHSGPGIAFELIPLVARQLGNAWEDDSISFADVTLGCARLQRALHHLTDDAPAIPFSKTRRKSCLVILPAGAQHTLGAIILSKQLRHAGMRVTLDLAATPDKMERHSKTQSFDAVLVSASVSETSDILRPIITAAHAQCADSKVILGGSFQDRGPKDVEATGAKFVMQSWQEALDTCI